ncbi:MAG: glutathione peroxidase [Pigmentiphaga sp.]|nr:glutathione peroxidase [Pigmentiphaga sp.]
MSRSLESIPVQRIDGTEASLAEHSGKVRLVVNVASQCGLTPQYEGLQALYDAYREQGFEVLGFPANDFKAQEPGTNEEIAQFCSGRFGVTFPMFAKISVKGDTRHPLYDALVEAQPQATQQGTGLRDRLAANGLTPENPAEVLWNFEKFLVDRDGQVIGRFAPDIAPQDPLITAAIERALA